MLALPFRHARHDPETRRLRRVRRWWRPRHWWWLPLIGALGVVAIGSIQLGVAGSQLVGARDDLLSGRFAVAENEFSQARDGLHNNPLLEVLRVFPPARRQLEALGLLADMGTHAARAARMGEAAIRGQDMAQLSQVEQELRRLSADRSRIPASGLAPPIRQAMALFDARYDQATDVLTMLPLVSRVLGNGGTDSYLVLQQDPAELRATGGFIGSVAFLDFDHGKMRPVSPIDIEAIDGLHLHRVLGVAGDPKYVAPPAPLTRVLDPGDSWELRDENFSPDFPTSARRAEFFLARETGRRVEGVIAVDPYLVADLLSITGPVTVPQTGDVLTSQNVFDTTLRRVELHRGPTPRKSFLSEATTAVLDRLKKMPAGSWLKLAKVLQRACSSKDIQAYFDDPAAEALVNRFSCGGQVPVFRQDGLMVVDTNLNSNKDDFWITRSFSLDIQRRSDDAARHTLRISYGPFPDLEQLTTPYFDWLRLYLPSDARLVSASGISAHQGAELGDSVVQGWVQFASGQRKEVTIVYDVPQVRMQGAGRRMSLTWLKQAGRIADPIVLRVAQASGGQGTSLRSDLRQDRVFVID